MYACTGTSLGALAVSQHVQNVGLGMLTNLNPTFSDESMQLTQ